MTETLLIIEDESLVGSELARHYRKRDWEVVVAASLAEAKRTLLDGGLGPLVVLSDMSLPDGNALDLLETARHAKLGGEWIFITAYGGVRDSVRALHLGAVDFLEKPVDLERLDLVVESAARSARAQRRLRDEAHKQAHRYGPSSFLGRSGAAQSVRSMLERLVRVPFSTLLLTGESGTGKGLAARILHHGGARADGPLVEVNCAALPKELLESELFGHEAGAFTGAKGRRRGLVEQASGGTLFLDELGELDLALQAKLLKVIEDRALRRLGGEHVIPVDVQLIAATNRDPRAEVQAGRLRPDLYHRLAAFELRLPPLRERPEDLRDLVPPLVEELNRAAGKNVRELPEALWEQLEAHAWPGNVRELRNAIERGVLLAEDERFPLAWLQLGGGLEAQPTESGGEVVVIPLDGSMALDEMERHILERALDLNDFNVAATARALKTTRETLRYRIQKYDLKPR